MSALEWIIPHQFVSVFELLEGARDREFMSVSGSGPNYELTTPRECATSLEAVWSYCGSELPCYTASGLRVVVCAERVSSLLTSEVFEANENYCSWAMRVISTVMSGYGFGYEAISWTQTHRQGNARYAGCYRGDKLRCPSLHVVSERYALI